MGNGEGMTSSIRSYFVYSPCDIFHRFIKLFAILKFHNFLNVLFVHFVSIYSIQLEMWIGLILFKPIIHVEIYDILR